MHDSARVPSVRCAKVERRFQRLLVLEGAHALCDPDPSSAHPRHRGAKPPATDRLGGSNNRAGSFDDLPADGKGRLSSGHSNHVTRRGMASCGCRIVDSRQAIRRALMDGAIGLARWLLERQHFASLGSNVLRRKDLEAMCQVTSTRASGRLSAPCQPAYARTSRSVLRTRPRASMSSLSSPPTPFTVWTKPDSMSTQIWHFMSKYHF